MQRLRFVALALLGCGSSSSGISESDIACPTNNSLTYANFAKDLVANKCLGCHAGARSPNLSTQASLKANGNRVIDMAVFSTEMPDEGSMSTDERKKLGQWLRCGAP
jgi:uncharacterized membrane protein